MNENTYRTAKTVLITATITIASVFAFSFVKEQNRQDSEFFCNGAPVVIKDGDTLYWIARANCDGNIMNVVDKLVSLYGSDLTVGQTIYLPTHPNCEMRLTDGGQVVDGCK
jgi:hypothetical protein